MAIKRPNVVLIYTDQQRWDTIRTAGNPHVISPNLDALAASGTLFENAFINCPVCMPSRQSMLSGLYPATVGCRCNGIEMPEEILTIQKVLGLYGYHTANIGKLHFKNHSNRDHREIHPAYGFDELVLSDEPGCYDDAYIKWVEEHDPDLVPKCRCLTPPAWRGEPTDAPPREVTEPYVFEGPEELTHTAFVCDETAQYIRRRARGAEPFFVIAGIYAPHAPVNPPQRFVDMYNPDDMPPPAMNEGENPQGLSEDEWKKVKACYYALCTHIDDQVGRILAALDETGLRDDTVVVFTSDHGEHLGDHGAIGKGPPGYDSCAHVPLILSCPGRIPEGTRQRELIEHVDLAPTLIDYCGIQIPPRMQGRSFRPLLTGRDYAARDSVYIEFLDPHRISWKTIRTDAVKYCTTNHGQELLFDLEKDPHELRNVASDPAYGEALAEMRHALLRRWFDVESHYPLRTGAY